MRPCVRTAGSLLHTWRLERPPRLARSYAQASKPMGALEQRIAAIPLERYRNFCIVAHVDHGKSTLSDRLLELTGTIAPGGNKQILDKLDVERERGITVKAQTCTMLHRHRGDDYLLHLVDTPGHVDFRAEVSRSYASCGGALLLVDASQGVQAQTVANFYLAFAQGLTLMPVLNKVDLPHADPPRVLEQMRDAFELDPAAALLVSAKTGLNVAALLPAVVEKMPAPVGDLAKPLRMLLVDSWYDVYKGVILLVRLFDGQVRPGDTIRSFATGLKYIVGEVGIMHPDQTPQTVLRAGQVGYIHFNPGMKRSQEAKVGDTYTTLGSEKLVEPYPGFEEPKSMVFVAAYPTDQDNHEHLQDSIEQITLNDRSVTLQKESSDALGAGWRLGFLGTLHCSVFEDRLRQEHGANIIITPPSVPFKVIWRDGTESIVTNPNDFPDQEHVYTRVQEVHEPYVSATITLPDEYLGEVIKLCEANRGEQNELTFFTAKQVILKYHLPLSHLVDDFFGKLKGATKGYASLDYEDAGYRKSSIVKLNLLVNGEPVDAVSRVLHTSQVDKVGRKWVEKFKDHVDRQMFEVIIQAAAGRRIVARATIKPFRKDVLAKLHASDLSRRRKLLEKQKEGRKKLRAVGSVVIEQEAFQKFLAK
ncbi:GTP-binding protein-like protein GUF1 [Ampelomyces quisqualis]|uniref:GTP-binding protein-like protein GUF1 n=1 Tax=Ampelomyces quisqualis TaxID=50730 RepID=A0A6A5QRX1_AMPQU|nr:GTP-binding protein-like protein GUF1 [Ampelomyces quisqualis]